MIGSNVVSLITDPYMANSNEIESSLSTVLMYTHMVGVLYILYRGLLVLCASYTIRISQEV